MHPQQSVPVLPGTQMNVPTRRESAMHPVLGPMRRAVQREASRYDPDAWDIMLRLHVDRRAFFFVSSLPCPPIPVAGEPWEQAR